MALLKPKDVRRAHACVGAAGAVFLACTAVTGLLWSNAQRWYWSADDYKKKKTTIEAPSLDTALPSDKILKKVKTALPDQKLTGLSLRAEAGRLVYEVQAGKTPVLVDAKSGSILSPLTEQDAAAFADQYVKGSARLEAKREETFFGRDHRKRGPVWRFKYEDKKEIVLDALSGQIIEEYDPSRRFHFWVMKLHKLDFFGTDKALTVIPGTLLLLMLLSGLKLWRKPS